MKVVVTGATGFVGRHVVRRLVEAGAAVVATSNEESKAAIFAPYPSVEFVPADLSDCSRDYFSLFRKPDSLVHLAWAGLPHYRETYHFERNLFESYAFVKQMVLSGVSDVSVAGTCFEYGLAEGCLSEDRPANPANSYAVAKDALRRFLQELCKSHSYRLKWIRLFYLYGEGQRPDTLMGQLNAAIAGGDETFDMSGGEQLRDYLPIEEAARYMAHIALQTRVTGVINCCSGRPISVRRLVEQVIARAGARIRLNLGRYPYSELEPMAFWGSTLRLREALAAEKNL